MPTDNRRIAAYLPKEIDDRFQAFKQEKGVSESKALILLMSEYFGVSQKVAYSSDSPLAKQVEEMSSLLSELRSELSTKVGEERIGELKGELLSELKASSSSSKSKSNSPKQLDIGGEIAETQQKVKKSRGRKKSTESKEVADGVNSLIGVQLDQRLRVKKYSVGKMKNQYKDNPDRFKTWSKDRDPDGYAWEFRSGSSLFYRVSHLEPLA
jgi:hypothetical protein